MKLKYNREYEKTRITSHLRYPRIRQMHRQELEKTAYLTNDTHKLELPHSIRVPKADITGSQAGRLWP